MTTAMPPRRPAARAAAAAARATAARAHRRGPMTVTSSGGARFATPSRAMADAARGADATRARERAASASRDAAHRRCVVTTAIRESDARAAETDSASRKPPTPAPEPARANGETTRAGVRNTDDDAFDAPVPRKPFSLWRFIITRMILLGVVFRRALAVTAYVVFGSAFRFLSAVTSNAFGRVVFSVFLITSGILTYRGSMARKVKAPTPPTTMYSAFLKDLRAGKIASVRFEEGSTRLLYDLKPQAQGKGGAAVAATEVKTYQTKRLMADMELMKKLENAGVEFGAVPAAVSRLASKGMFTVLAMWLPIIPLMIIMRNAINRQSGGGKKRKKAAPKDDVNKVTFADVAGVEDAKAELYELVQIMKNADQYKNVRGRLPTGCLLVGPPGTGKTLLARAVAGESNVAFFPVAASEFVELFVGRGAARVRELFAEARKSRPAIIFIDELDAVGSRRGAGLNEERDQTLNQLLVEMDGFAKDSGILILAATNRPDALDPALLRPGRLTRRVFVGPPGQQGRAQILSVHLRGIDLEDDVDVVCDVVSRATPGFTGAELANVCNEAALLSVRDNRQLVTMNDLLSGVSRTKDGIATSSNRADAMFRELRNRFLGNYKDAPTLNDVKEKFGPGASGNGVPISMGPS